MSKVQLKKELQKQLIGPIAELYASFKSVRVYYKPLLKPVAIWEGFMNIIHNLLPFVVRKVLLKKQRLFTN
jgi:hypothetical protein